MGLNPDDVNDPPASGSSADPSRPEMFPRSYVEQLRAEAAQHRTRNKALEGQLSKLSDADNQIRGLKLTNALLKHGANDPDMLEFFLRKEGQWDDLDPDDADTLKDRVDDLLARRPELKQHRPPTRSSSGSIPPGGPGGPSSTQVTRSELAGMTPEAIERALRDGNLNAILGRR
jgi:hypothetical protein